jgi:non-heme chloroperoxidase
MVTSVTLSSGVTLQYADRGRASGMPLLFLHGATDSWRSFEPVLDRLPGTLRGLAITQRGHGHSSKPEDGYRCVNFADDVVAFMDAVDLGAAVIVGHSMGSMVAQRLAVDHPARVAGLVLTGAFRTLYDHCGVREFWDSALVTLGDPIDPAFARAFQVSTLHREIAPELLDVMVGESLQVPARVWRALFSGFLETSDFSHELRRLTAPALIVWGECDTYAPREDQEALHELIAGSRLLTYSGIGHAVHWEDPDRFVTDLVGFVCERR